MRRSGSGPDASGRPTALGWLLAHLAELPGSGIVYTLTVSGAEDIARLLRENGYAVRAYTGRTDNEEREQLEQQLKANELKALVATSALGMGFDKPDLGFVVHIGAPSSPVAYYQQIGRAGRATDNADVLLLPGREDQEIWQYFASASMPTESRAAAVLGALSTDTAMSTVALEGWSTSSGRRSNSCSRCSTSTGPCAASPGWVSTGQPWQYDAARYERVAAARAAEASSMLAYESTTACRMQLLQQDLDDPSAEPCGRCDNCAGVWYPTAVSDSDTSGAAAALDRVGVEVAPRAQWPSACRRSASREGADPRRRARGAGSGDRPTDGPRVGRPPAHLFASSTPDGPVSKALVDGCVRALKDWPWAERPTGVVAMSSRSRPELVASLAQALSTIGRLRFLGTLGGAGASRAGTVRRTARTVGRGLGHVRGRPRARGCAAGARGPVLLVDRPGGQPVDGDGRGAGAPAGGGGRRTAVRARHGRLTPSSVGRARRSGSGGRAQAVGLRRSCGGDRVQFGECVRRQVMPAPATFARRCSTDDVPGISRMFGERCSSHASATDSRDSPRRSATASRAPDWIGEKPPSGK